MTTLRRAHRCKNCGKVIPAGTKVNIHLYKKEKYYPVKGLMRFMVYHYSHISCQEGG